MTHCTNCGTPLRPDMTACPTCGKPTTTEPATSYSPGGPVDYHARDDAIPYVDFGAFQESAPSSSTPGVKPAGQAQQSQALPSQQPAPQANMYAGQQTPPQAPDMFAPRQQPTPQTPNSFKAGQQFPPQGGSAPQFNMYAPGQTPPPQAPNMFAPGQQYPAQQAQQQPGIYMPGQVLAGQPQEAIQPQKRGISGRIITLLVVLAVVLIGGSMLVYYAAVVHPEQLNVQATSTAQTFQMNNLHATQTAMTNAANATATFSALSPQDLYTRVTAGTPTLNDPLTSQSSTTWSSLGSSNSSCTFAGGSLHATSSTGSAGCVALGNTYSNFAYQVQMTIMNGDLGGIFFRTDQVNRKLYLLALSPQGVYVLAYTQPGSSGYANGNVLAASVSPAINTGLHSTNILGVIARDNDIYIFINKQFITKVSDNTSKAGEIGVMSGSSKNTASEATFNNAQVWNI
ncbi:MAG: hypothetical protein ACJ788_18930 [Ktedonobacteraceae bacterium]